VIVAINTSFQTTAVGVGSPTGLLGMSESEEWPVSLEVLVGQALGQADKQYGLDGEVEAVVVAVGPGRFAALRGGVAFAKGFSFARGIPVIGVTSVNVVLGATRRSDCVVVLPAGRKRWYVAEPDGFDARLVTGEMLRTMLKKDHLIAALDDSCLPETAEDFPRQRLAVSGVMALESMIESAFSRLIDNSGPASFGAEPIYVQPPTAAAPWDATLGGRKVGEGG
jgi:tRNA A37 threonylcarbamoyladenosine modification protein TsaB